MNKTRFYCNICRNETWHEMVAQHKQSHYSSLWGYAKIIHGQILKCCGCDYLSFRLYEHPFEFEKKVNIIEHIYPTREYEKRKHKFFFQLPEKIRIIYQQTVKSYDNKLYLLSVIGLRALIEAIVTDRLYQSEYETSIHSKIEALRKFFSDEIIDTLHDFRFMGNKAVHELEEPDDELDIHRALNVLEDIMTFFYGVEESAWLYKFCKTEAMTPQQQIDYANLIKWRRNKANEEGIPAFAIAHNKHLEQIVKLSEKNKDGLLKIMGFGQKRTEKYGKDILALLKS